MIDDFVNLDGVTLHYHEYPYDGETIIFLHFGFSSLAMWNGVVPFFEGKYRLILPDYRAMVYLINLRATIILMKWLMIL